MNGDRFEGNLPAFPGMEYDNTAGQRYHYGMTLRDYFAGQALQGIMGWVTKEKKIAETVKEAYSVADEMLKQRSKADSSAVEQSPL